MMYLVLPTANSSQVRWDFSCPLWGVDWSQRPAVGVREPHCWNDRVALSQGSLAARLAPLNPARGGKAVLLDFQIGMLT